MKTVKIIFVCFVLVVALFTPNAKAIVPYLMPVSISANDIVIKENFSEPRITSNSVVCSTCPDIIYIATCDKYTFANSGATMTSPVPNRFGNWQPGIAIIDHWVKFNFGGYGTRNDADPIPGDNGDNKAGCLLQTGNSSDPFPETRITFPSGVKKFGGNFIMSGQPQDSDWITVTAYNLAGKPMSLVYILACNVSDWANNFTAFAMSDGTPIGSIGISFATNNKGANPGVANLQIVRNLTPDISADGFVNVCDLQMLVIAWARGPNYNGPEDINGDSYVNVCDLQFLVANWGWSAN